MPRYPETLSPARQEKFNESLVRILTGVKIPEGVTDSIVLQGERYEARFRGERMVGPRKTGVNPYDRIAYFCCWKGEGTIIDTETGEEKPFKFETADWYEYNYDYPEVAISLEGAVTHVSQLGYYRRKGLCQWVDEDAPKKANDLLLKKVMNHLRETKDLSEGDWHKKVEFDFTGVKLTMKELIGQGLIFDIHGQRHIPLGGEEI